MGGPRSTMKVFPTASARPRQGRDPWERPDRLKFKKMILSKIIRIVMIKTKKNRNRRTYLKKKNACCDMEKYFIRLVGCLVGWLVGCLVGSSVGWLVGWLLGWLVGELVGWVVDWLVCCLVGLVVGSFVSWLAGWLGDWVAGWLGGWVVAWPLLGCLVAWLLGSQYYCVLQSLQKVIPSTTLY